MGSRGEKADEVGKEEEKMGLSVSAGDQQGNILSCVSKPVQVQYILPE
jgi:hypothetical protein